MLKRLLPTFKANNLNYAFYVSFLIVVIIALSVTGYFIQLDLKPNSQPAVTNVPEEPVPNQVVISFKDGTSNEDKKAYIESIGGTVVSELGELNSVVISTQNEVNIEELPISDIVASNEPDYYVSVLATEVNDPDFDKQWGLKAVGAETNWETETVDAGTVAVIDSGVCLNHEDLSGKFVNGWDFVNNDADADDEFGHGCSVAGIIAASIKNNKGIAGVSQNAKIMPVKVLDNRGIGTYSNVAQGIIFAADNNAKVINLSLGGVNESQLLKSAVDYALNKGITVVAAAGNSGTEGVLYPAKYEGVIAVGSVDENLERSSFSNFGAEVDYWAPGRDIYTSKNDGAYGYVSGTSFAAPFVSGTMITGSVYGLSTDTINTEVTPETNSSTHMEQGFYDINAQASFDLNPNDGAVSHIYWPFDNKEGWELNPIRSPFHYGSDFYAQDWNNSKWSTPEGPTADRGAPLSAPFSGEVVYAGNSGNGYGKQVVIITDLAPNFAVRIAHLDSISVSRGNRVTIGQVVGKLGDTGTPGAVHAHFSLYKNINQNYAEGITGYARLSEGGDLGGTSDQSAANKFAAAFLFDANSLPQQSDDSIILYNNPNFDASAGYMLIKPDLSRVTAVAMPTLLDDKVSSIWVGSKVCAYIYGWNSDDLNFPPNYADKSEDYWKNLPYEFWVGSPVASLSGRWNNTADLQADKNDSISTVVTGAKCDSTGNGLGLSAQATCFVGTAGGSTSNGDSAVFTDVESPEDDQIIAPNTTFTKTWQFRNTGTTTWNTGYKIVYQRGDRMTSNNSFNLTSSVAPGQTINVNINLTTPSTTGDKVGYWQLANVSGATFGPEVFVDIKVENGGGGGSSSGVWKTEYYNGQEFNSKVSTEYIASTFIDKDWGANSPAAGVNADGFSVRFERTVNLPTSGNWKFKTVSDDGFRLYIDGAILDDKWWVGNQDVTPSRDLSAGDHTIKLEVFDSTGNAKAQLSWGKDTPPPPSGASTWKIDYFVGKDLANFNRTENNTLIYEPYLNFDWGMGSPSGVGPDFFSIRAEKSVYFPESGKYKFDIQSDDGMRVWVDGEKIYDEWWEAGTHTGGPSPTLSAGNHTVKVEYFDARDNALMKVSWQRDFGDGYVRICSISTPQKCENFTEDVPKFSQTTIGNDNAKSIEMFGNAGWSATLFIDDNYNNGDGNVNGYEVYNGTDPDLDNNKVGRGASSMMIRKHNPPKYTLFDQGGFSNGGSWGNGQSFNSSRDITNLSYWDWSDRARAIKIYKGYEVVVCKDDNFRGMCGRHYAEHADVVIQDIRELNTFLVDPWPNDKPHASSIRVCQGKCPDGPVAPTILNPLNSTNIVPGNNVNFQWSGNGTEYWLQLEGGALTQPIYSGLINANSWSKSGLTYSPNPYRWTVKSWNGYGESISSQGTFYIQDIAPSQVYVFGSSNLTVNTDATYEGYITPSDATNLQYIWAPTPKAGQGTATATYNFTQPGSKHISLTVQNTSGSVTTTRNININCAAGDYTAEYFTNKDLAGNAINKQCESKIDYNWGVDGPSALGQFGSGKDGNLTITQNTDDSPIDAVANGNFGTTTLNATNPLFLPGQKILIHQTRGANASNYQITEIVAYSAGVITTKDLLVTNYSSTGDNRAQVMVLKEYDNVTVNSGVTWSAKPWNGTTGGILLFYVKGTLNVQGNISADGKGFRGGTGGSAPTEYSDTGDSGEASVGSSIAGGSSCAGCPSSPIGGLNGSAGQGAQGKRADDSAAGGGGGAHRTQGTGGANSKGGAYALVGGGSTGTTIGIDNLKVQMHIGSGGGGGGKSKDPNGQGGGNGGTGGGIVGFMAKQVNITGTVTSKGANGQNGISSEGGGGGAGAGGSILAEFRDGSVANNSFIVNGGSGGNGAGQYNARGGNGGEGRTMVNYCNSLNGSANSAAYTTTFSCNTDNFSTRWVADKYFAAGDYIFNTNSDDGARVYVDNNLVIDNWTNGSSIQTATTTLTEGNHNIKVEYYEATQTAHINFVIYPASNQAPTVSQIPNQAIGKSQQFSSFDLDNFVNDANNDPITWTYSGNSALGINVATGNVVTINKPSNWFGSESITFTAKDPWESMASVTVQLKSYACETGQYYAEYYNGNTLGGNIVNGECVDKVDYNWGAGGPTSIGQFGSGKDGALTITQNTTDAPIDSQATGTSGTYTLNVNHTVPFQVGQKILIHKSRGDFAGAYQLTQIMGYAGGVITTKDVLTLNYNNDAVNRSQVLVVKEYTNVTVNPGATWSAKDWDGTVGGILFFYANGTVTINGTISANGKGFRGGDQSNPPAGQHPFYGLQGEGIGGDRNTRTLNANWNAGGGGREPDNNGGGGGANGSAGSNGWGNAAQGGVVVGNADLTSMNFGGGGGGGAPGGGGMEYGLAGGDGGGIVGIYAENVNLNGSLNAVGLNGGIDSRNFGGGGGGGGSIKLKVNNINYGNSRILAIGGSGGGNRPGGNGGTGRVRLDYCGAIDGSSNPANSLGQISCTKDNFSVRWTGAVNFTTATSYIFNTLTDDGTKVWLDGNLIIDGWSMGYESRSATVEVTPGLHEVKMEYFDNTGNAEAHLNIAPAANQAPAVTQISNQSIGTTQTFTPFDLDTFGNDPEGDPLTWTVSGNSNIAVAMNAEKVVNLTFPANWIGEENITFTAKDLWGLQTAITAKFKVNKCTADEYQADYFNNKDLNGNPINSICVPNIDFNWGADGPAEIPYSENGDGRDGNLTVNTGQTAYTDNVRTSLSLPTAIGQNNMAIASNVFNVGDVILIIQMTGENVGNYEQAVVTKYENGAMFIDHGLARAFTANANSKAQIIKIPQYKDVTVNGTLTAHPWDGSTGGVVIFKATGTVTINASGNINTDGIGYRGGVGTGVNLGGQNGESTDGYVGRGGSSGGGAGTFGGGSGAGRDAISPAGIRGGGAGSGGYDYTGAGSNDEGTGGGGGGGHTTAGGGGGGGGDSFGAGRNGGFSGGITGGDGGNRTFNGGNGGFHGSSGATGAGGSSWGSADVGTGGGGGGGANGGNSEMLIVMGSGGGASGAYQGRTSGNVFGKNGGNGGGIIHISARNYVVNGRVSSNGANGETANGKAGAGGGGAAGTIVLRGKTVSATNQVQTIGGNGGGPNGASAGGGQGGTGIIFLSHCGTLNGNSNPAAIVSQFECPKDNYSIRFTKNINPVGTKFNLKTYSDDGIKVWAGDTLLHNNWTNGYSEVQKQVTVTPGEQVLKVEYYEGSGTAQVKVEFDAIPNNPPVVIPIPDQTIEEDGTFEIIDLSEFATDADQDDVISWEYGGNVELLVSIDENNIATITAPANWSGEEIITFVAKDSQNAEASTNVLFISSALNDAPEILSDAITSVNEDTTYTYDVEAIDSENDTLTYSLTTNPTGMTINSETGVISWVPDNSNVGNHTVTVEVSDGNSVDTQTFELTVNNTNDAPVFTSTSATSVNAGTLYHYIATATDADNDPLTFMFTQSPLGMSLNGLTGEINWTPTNAQAGDHNISLDARDGTAVTTQNFVITVNYVNTTPVVSQIPGQTINEDAVFTAFDLDSYVTDPDANDVITWEITGNTNLQFSKDTDNVFLVTTPANWNGSEIFTFKATDLNGNNTSTTAEFIVIAVNDIPMIDSTAVTNAFVFEEYSYDVQASDFENDTLIYNFEIAPAGMTIDSATGVISWTPTEAQQGNQEVKVLVSDGQDTVWQIFTIAVAYNPNLFVNSIDDHIQNMDGWTFETAGGFAAGQDTEAIKIETALNNNSIQQLSSKWVNVEIGKTYHLAVNEKTATADQAKVMINLYDANFNFIGTGRTLLGASNTRAWTEYRTSYKIPATLNGQNVKYAKVILQAGDGYAATSTSATTWFDDIYFSQNGRPYASSTVTPAVIKENDMVTLNSSASRDPDGNTNLQYYWTQLSGPTISNLNTFGSTSNFNAPDTIFDYSLVLELRIFDGQVYSLPIQKTINVKGLIPEVRDELSNQDYWLNNTPNDFVTTIDDGSLKITALGANKTSQVISPYVPVSTEAYKLRYKLTTEASKAMNIRVIGYNENFGTVATHTCVATGMTGTKPWKEIFCDIPLFVNNPTIKYARVRIDFTSNFIASNAKFDYIWLASPNNMPYVTQIPNQTVDEDKPFATINLDSYEINNAPRPLRWTYNGHIDLQVSIDANNIATITAPDNWSGEETIGFAAWSQGMFVSGPSFATFKVNAVNDKPVISSTAITNALISNAYEYDVEATDVENSVLTFSLTEAPAGMNIDSETGLISWTPEVNQYGGHNVKVQVFDGTDVSEQSFILITTNTNDEFITSIDDHMVDTNGWTADAASGFTITHDAEALEVQTTLNENAIKQLSSKWINVEVGKTYHLAANSKSETADQAKVLINLYDANLNLIGTARTLNTALGTRPYAEYRTSYKIPATFNTKAVKYAKVILQSGDIQTTAGTNAATWFDDIYFNENGRPYGLFTTTPTIVKDKDVVTLNATTSKDPDGNTNLQYNWTQVSGPTITDLIGESTATFTAPDNNLDYSVAIKLVVRDGQVESLPLTKTINIKGTIEQLSEQFVNQDLWINNTTPNFTTAIENETLNINALTINKVSQILSPYIFVDNADYKLTFKVKTENAKALNILAIGYNSNFTAVNTKTCTSGLTGTKDWKEVICDITNFVTYPTIKYTRIRIDFTSLSTASKAWVDYINLDKVIVNNPPVISEIPSQVTNEDIAFVSFDLDNFVTDSNGDVINWSFSGSNLINITINVSNEVIATTPANWNGSETIIFTATDTNGATDSQEVNFTVSSVNDAPILTGIPDQTINPGAAFESFDLDNFTTDVEGDSITYSFAGNTSLNVELQAENIVVITYSGDSYNELITFTATDANGASSEFGARFIVNSAPHWENLNEMSVTRRAPGVTKLQDGRILVSGGFTNGNSINSTEIYNPTNGEWTSTGNMNIARMGPTSTLLSDGRVMVTGGYNPNAGTHVISAEIYDPNTGAWTQTPDMLLGRYAHEAALLPDGKLMVMGGFGQGVYSNQVDIYDPATNTWSPGTNMANGRGGFVSLTLSDGRIMVSGGYAGPVISSVEIYNPATSTWTNAASMISVRNRHTMTLLNDGRVLAIGGWVGDSIQTAEIYNPTNNTWSLTANIPTTLGDHTAVKLTDGRVMTIAGSPTNGQEISSTYIYNAADNTWTQGANLNTVKVLHRSIVLNDGKILTLGGRGPGENDLKKVEVLIGYSGV